LRDSKNWHGGVILLILLMCSFVAASFSLQSLTVVPSQGKIYYPPDADVLFEDEFESGNLGAWSGSSLTADDNASVISSAYEGTFSARFQTNPISSGTRYAYCSRDLSPVASEVYARAYFHIVDGLPLNDDNDRFGLIGFELGGQLQSTFRVYRSGGVDRFNLIGFNGTSAFSRSCDSIFPVEGRWFCVEFHIRVHSSLGEYRIWINGRERIAVTGLDTTRYGSGVGRVRFGLSSVINVQHGLDILCDSVVVSTGYVGQLRYTFGVVGSVEDVAAIRNFLWLFGNQTISYRCISPSDVTHFEDLNRFDGLVVWTKSVGGYNASAIKQFAKDHVVIADTRDFCSWLYSGLSVSAQIVSTTTVSYVADWGNFRNGDKAEMRNETGNVDKVRMVLASGLLGFANVSIIARYDSSKVALFRMRGTSTNSGFYVLDLDVTTPETEWTGIWHVLPAVRFVHDLSVGRYARWMGNGEVWYDLSWVYSRVDTLVSANGDIADKLVIGRSVEGRDIPAITIGSGSKNAIVDGSLHGNEKTGTFACLRIAELLIEYYRNDANWRSKLSEYRVIIVPVVNPDGFADNTRGNANGKDLNSQFPPDGTTTEPEAWALRWLMGNYTPTIYVNCHEGWSDYPLHMLYGNYESATGKTLTINAMKAANATFVDLKHWGWFTEDSSHVWIGKVRTILQGGKLGMAVALASYQYHASCMLLETFVWSSTWGAKKCLWALDYYPAVILSFIQNIQR